MRFNLTDPADREPFSIPFTRAVAALRAAGHTVEPQDIPGLCRIDGGTEVTMAQVIHIAQQLGVFRADR